MSDTPIKNNSTQATGRAQGSPRKTAATCASRYVNPTSANGRRMSIPPLRGLYPPTGETGAFLALQLFRKQWQSFQKDDVLAVSCVAFCQHTRTADNVTTELLY